MQLAHFHGPRVKIARSIQHRDALSAIVSEYTSGLGAGFRQTSETTWELVLSKSMPWMAPLVLGDCIHNLRSSLDLMVCDIARIRNKKIKDVKFPFVKDEAAYLALNPKNPKDGPFLELGQDVVDEVRKLRPWKVENGGHPLLRPLHDLDLRDKHRLILVLAEFVSVQADLTPFALAMVNELIEKENPGMAPLTSLPRAVLAGNPPTALIPGESILMPKGVHPKEAYQLTKGSIRIVFPRGETFGGRPVIETCTECIKFVDETVELFAAKFG